MENVFCWEWSLNSAVQWWKTMKFAWWIRMWLCMLGKARKGGPPHQPSEEWRSPPGVNPRASFTPHSRGFNCDFLWQLMRQRRDFQVEVKQATCPLAVLFFFLGHALPFVTLSRISKCFAALILFHELYFLGFYFIPPYGTLLFAIDISQFYHEWSEYPYWSQLA